MKKYIEMEIEVCLFGLEDIIRTSNENSVVTSENELPFMPV